MNDVVTSEMIAVALRELLEALNRGYPADRVVLPNGYIVHLEVLPPNKIPVQRS